MDQFRKHIMRVSYGHCWCIDCREKVDKKADRRRARARLKEQGRREGESLNGRAAGFGPAYDGFDSLLPFHNKVCNFSKKLSYIKHAYGQ